VIPDAVPAARAHVLTAPPPVETWEQVPAARAHVLIFSKAPFPGYCNTRLAATVGGTAAARLQVRLLRRVLTTATASGLDCSLWCAPDCAHPTLLRLRRRYGVALHRQQQGDLGQRMSFAVKHVLKRAPAALVVGTDCPAMTGHVLYQAAVALTQGADAVFVPAEDGGFVLAGLRRRAPRLFRGIDWGGKHVMAQARRRARRLGLCWRELPALWDLDDRSDWLRARRGGWV